MSQINLKKYLEWLEKRNLSPKTIRVYNWVLQEYGERELNTENIVDFLKQNLTKYQPASSRSLYSGLISYSKFEKITIEWELINRLIPTTQQKFFPTINEAELEQLKQVKIGTNLFVNQRNNLILDFLFYTGIRVSELINLRHCDYSDKLLRISRGKGNKVRHVLLPDFLAKYFNGSSDYLFSNYQGQNHKISWVRIWMLIQKRASRAGFTKHISPHTLRRSFATLANKKEVKLTTIQKQLGHSNINTTTNYIHNSYEELRQDYNKIFNPPPPPTAAFCFLKK